MNKLKLNATLVAALLLGGSAVYANAADTGAKVGQYADDSVITSSVKAKILKEPGLKVAEINVETEKGVVLLSGFVANPADVAHAQKVAATVKGVKSVKNDIQVK